MKVLINREALHDVMALASSVVMSRTPKPVLTCVKLAAVTGHGGKRLLVAATDMEIALQCQISQVDISEAGTCLVPADKLADLVGSSREDVLTLATEEDDAVIMKTADAEFRIFSFKVDEFPPLASDPSGTWYTVPAGELRRMIRKTSFAIAPEATRYCLNGLMLELRGKKLQAVATDGHILAIASTSLDETGGGDSTAVIPNKAMRILDKLLTDPEYRVRLQIDRHKIFVCVSDTAGAVVATLSTVLIEGTFPPYQDVIPKNSDKKVELNRERMIYALKRARQFTNEQSKGVRLGFAGKMLTLSTRAPESGTAKIEVPVEYSGEALEIGFNPAYLLEALEATETETVMLEMSTPNMAGVLKSGRTFLCVCMPINLT